MLFSRVHTAHSLNRRAAPAKFNFEAVVLLSHNPLWPLYISQTEALSHTHSALLPHTEARNLASAITQCPKIPIVFHFLSLKKNTHFCLISIWKEITHLTFSKIHTNAWVTAWCVQFSQGCLNSNSDFHQPKDATVGRMCEEDNFDWSVFLGSPFIQAYEQERGHLVDIPTLKENF